MLKPWCVIAVEATGAAHADLATDPDFAPILPAAADRQRVRDLLASHGEANPPDTAQACFDRLRGSLGQDVADLRVS